MAVKSKWAGLGAENVGCSQGRGRRGLHWRTSLHDRELLVDRRSSARADVARSGAVG